MVLRTDASRVLLGNLQLWIGEPYEIRDLVVLFWITDLGRDHAIPIVGRFVGIPSRWSAKLSEGRGRDKTGSVQAIPAMDVHRPLALSDDVMELDEHRSQGRAVVPLVIVILERISSAADILGSVPSGSIRVHCLREAGFAKCLKRLILQRSAWTVDTSARTFGAAAIQDPGHDDSKMRESCSVADWKELLFLHIGVVGSRRLRKSARCN
ncbi:hypothetical protein XI06_41475 [Bradyrhizobium sp. CCBAU 11434]|nr:hypothetical protein [Bradyrhizobium sp. CCBAU 11434]